MTDFVTDDELEDIPDDDHAGALELPEILRALRTTRSGRQLLASYSPSWFGVYYLGLRYAEHQRKWADAMHGLKAGGRLLLLAPRAHGKTETVLSVLVQLIAENRDVRILLVCKTSTLAQKRLRRVKIELESNRKLHRDYGTFKPSKLPSYLVGVTADADRAGPVQIGYWTEKYIYVDRPGKRTDPTLEAAGWRGAVTGGRFDWVIFEDPIDALSAASETEREKAADWLYDTALELLEPDGRAIAIGTRKHGSDIYQTMMDDPTFTVIHDRAIDIWPEFTPVYSQDGTGRAVLDRIELKGPCKVLWPEHWPAQRLLAKYIAAQSTVGARVWIRENQNEVTDDGSSTFPMVFFKGGLWQPAPSVPETRVPGCRDYHRSWCDGSYSAADLPGLLMFDDDPPKLSDLLLVQHWDLGLVADTETAEANDSDFTVGITTLVDLRTMTRFKVGMFRDRGLSPFAVLKTVAREYARFGGGTTPDLRSVVVIESVLFQAIYPMMLREKTDMPVVGHTTGRGKADPATGLPHIAALAEGGKIRFPYRTQQDRERTATIEQEWHAYPRGKHDDTLLAEYVGESRILAVELVANREAAKTAKAAARAATSELPARPSRRL